MKLQSLLLSTILILSGLQLLNAQITVNYTDHSMTIAGTSTLHDWESEVTEMSANGSLSLNEGELNQLTWFEVTIPVRSIVSPKGSVMDKKTYEALKADDHPDIIFRLTKVNSITPSGNAYKVNARGFLTMAGYTKTVDLTVTAIVGSDGTISFEGSKDLKMSDFNMEQPTAMLGTIKTGDEVTVKFNVTMAGDLR